MKHLFFKSISLAVTLAGILTFMNASKSDAQMLVGGVTVNEKLPQAKSPELKKLNSMGDAKMDKIPAPAGDCICFNQNRVEAKLVDGNWKVVDGDHWILDFNNNSANAQLAATTIRNYQMNEICFVGRNTGRPMMYFLSNGKAPQGKLEGEDAIPFDTTQVKAEEIDGHWKLTCGSLWMEDFGTNADCAKAAAEQIKYYGFTRQCYIGRPGPLMEYFAK